ncbi:DUF3533 domain-containing protein [Streptomyces gilvosporeus]|uniref:ABC transporter n=1 Tax=Streptomyces gilvosporeus TaxID=553510 RepID=A0A1V0U1X1_9ACTN|nr:ABC transporter [Streptomyces gilvosporeus]
MGGIVNPPGELHRLPIAVIDADRSTPLPGQRENLGAQITHTLLSSSSDKVEWRSLTPAQAQRALGSGKVYGALSIPVDFTRSVATLATTADTLPVLKVLTNPATGGLGSGLAQTIATQAATQASLTLGKQSTTSPVAAKAPSAARLLLADPVRITTQPGHPLGNRSGLGLTSFYYALLLVLLGFLIANVTHTGVDSALGYTDSEFGPWHSRRPTVPVNRTQTFLVKMGVSAGITTLTTTLLMVATVGVLGMDAAHLPLLWIYSYCATLAVSLGAGAIYAAAGGVGQLVAMLVFIVMGIPSSGATIPLEATSGFYRFLSLFEPMHHLADGVRAILYFDARGDAGLTRAWIMIAIGFGLAVLLGLAITRYYDRKGLKRLTVLPA